jgi:hypothetical protein
VDIGESSDREEPAQVGESSDRYAPAHIVAPAEKKIFDETPNARICLPEKVRCSQLGSVLEEEEEEEEEEEINQVQSPVGVEIAQCGAISKKTVAKLAPNSPDSKVRFANQESPKFGPANTNIGQEKIHSEYPTNNQGAHKSTGDVLEIIQEESHEEHLSTKTDVSKYALVDCTLEECIQDDTNTTCLKDTAENTVIELKMSEETIITGVHDNEKRHSTFTKQTIDDPRTRTRQDDNASPKSVKALSRLWKRLNTRSSLKNTLESKKEISAPMETSYEANETSTKAKPPVIKDPQQHPNLPKKEQNITEDESKELRKWEIVQVIRRRTLLPRELTSRYELLDLMGDGAFGFVFSAHVIDKAGKQVNN